MKTMMKGRKVWLAALVMGLMIGGWVSSMPTFEFQPQTSIAIKGTSTMHDFECKAGVVSGAINIPAPAADAQQTLGSLQSVTVSVPVEKIDCGNGTMDKKMRSALESGKAPLIKYTLTKATVAGAANAQGFYPLNTTGKLSIAGQERPIEMSVLGKQLADGSFQFTGSKKIKMTDWGIKPPTAMLGTMKTGDEVTVSFQVLAAN